jgi:hypothetical protein
LAGRHGKNFLSGKITVIARAGGGIITKVASVSTESAADNGSISLQFQSEVVSLKIAPSNKLFSQTSESH